MPAKDQYHTAVRQALLKAGWSISHDPYAIVLPERFLYIDLRATHFEQQRVITVEIKSFELPSPIEALAQAIGKYSLYRAALDLIQNTDALYLAIPSRAFYGIMQETLSQRLLQKHAVHLLVFDPDQQEVALWHP
ncbi:MAG: fatty-acid synthase [Chloroflexi bacterium CFX4]|nr:fatty-acid synthase [Chloroflexi bacterium CFX4]MDL1922594.1 fatty-acid synthase [Chloroflexi bacterium CFX3]